MTVIRKSFGHLYADAHVFHNVIENHNRTSFFFFLNMYGFIPNSNRNAQLFYLQIDERGGPSTKTGTYIIVFLQLLSAVEMLPRNEPAFLLNLNV